MFKDKSNYSNGEATTQQLIKNPKQDFEKAINIFLKGGTGKHGKYIAVKNALVYRTIITSRGDVSLSQNIIAYRTKSGQVLGNSSVLPLIGRTVAFGNEDLNRGETEVQRALSDLIIMVPFTVFTEAGLDLESFEVLERGPEESVTRDVENPKYFRWKEAEMLKKNIPEKITETVHFTGASLFKVDGQIYLFDIDREEIKHRIFNAFLVNIPKETVTTIKDAYQSLKPAEVLEAEKQDLKVIRQGEWFFIPSGPVDQKADKYTDEQSWGRRGYYKPMELKAGPNRPNNATFGIESKHLVKGRVSHSGREHRTIFLRQWHKAVPNTAIKSFTIEGDID